MQQAAVQGLGQQSGDSGSTIFRGTRCSEDAQLQIQPRALPSPPCRSLQTQRHFCAWRLQGCRGQMQGVLCGFLFPPPQLFAPRNQITLRAGNLLVLLQASLISWEQVIGKEQVRASQACYLIRSTLIADNFRPPGASKRKREELTPRGCSSRSTQLQKAPRDRAKLVPFTFRDD